ncbi:MAG: DNA polymerase III subunit alpha [bacterium]
MSPRATKTKRVDAAMSAFVHLHVHSEYSLSDGIVRIAPLAERAAQQGFPAVALTDLSNVHGVIKFHRACLACGVKPLIGCDVWIENPLARDRADRMIVLCRDNEGYRNLSRFLTEAHLRGQHKAKPVIAWRDFELMHGGLLALLDDHEGALAQHTAPGVAARSDEALLDAYQQLLGDRLYLQVSRVGHPRERDYIRRAAQLAAARGIALAATNRVEFIAAEEFDAHEIRVCINEGRVLADPRRPRRFTPQQYLRSAAEMSDLFADLPEAVGNTVEIAKRCNLFFDFNQSFLPAYPDAGDESVEQILRRLARDGLADRLRANGGIGDDDKISEDYDARLEHELGIIAEMGYPGYFLIVADFIRWAKENDIPVGPGRGSGAGSLVAWATGITELDPLRYGLLFERFLNPERVSLPDFDIDFCVDGRDRVIEYVAERYGREQVAQIITFGTMAAKASVRDVGRVMALPLGLVDQIAKLIPHELGMTLQKALNQESMLRQRCKDESEIQELIDNAMQLEGIARNVSTHAAGVVIAPRALTEYTPLFADAHFNQAVTQLDKDDLESIGLVKFDFLGLRTLTIIDLAVKMINQRRQSDNDNDNDNDNGDNDRALLDIATVPLSDAATYELIRSGRTIGIFQLESRGMKELILRLQPDQFDDLVALVALFRPGPLQSGMVDDFVARKHGRESIAYPHADLEPILKPTYGVIVYQEQVMQIARVLANYTLGGADVLRKAMGKKNPDEMAKQRKVFNHGAAARGVKATVATRIFDLMEKFAGYGFNKSHSVGYALVAYHTAWLKAHYPVEFMAAMLSAELASTDRVVELLRECAELGLEVLPPDVNACYHGFRPLRARTILYGVGAVKGVGKNVSERIEAARDIGGAFADLFDFCRRVDTAIAGKRVLEALVKSGAMDCLGEHRAALMADIADAMQAAEQQQLSQQTGQSDMFGAVEESPLGRRGRDAARWSEQQRLEAERETLGLYLTGHPYTRHRAELAEVAQTNVGAMRLSTPTSGIFAGLAIGVREKMTRHGKVAYATLDNAAERIEVGLYSDKYQRYRATLQKGKVLVVHGEFSTDEYTGGVKMSAEAVADLDAFRRVCLRRIRLDLRADGLADDAMRQIHHTLSAHRGGEVEITVRYRRAEGETGVLRLGPDWTIQPTQPLIDSLTNLLGAERIKFDYDAASLWKMNSNHTRQRARAAMG